MPLGFSGSSVTKELCCNAGDPCLIPGLGRSPGEGIGYPLQHSWDSLVTQTVKNSLVKRRKITIFALPNGIQTHTNAPGKALLSGTVFPYHFAITPKSRQF